MFLFAALISAFMFASCGGDSASSKVEPIIKVTPLELNVSSLGEERSIDVIATCMWEAETDVDWIDMSRKKGGVDDKQCVVKIGANTNSSSRSATIAFSNSAYALVQRVKVVQDGYSADLLCPEDIEVDYQAGTKKIEVRSNVDFKVSKSQGDWLTVSKSGYNISFTYSANQSEEPREAVITITNEEYKISEQFLFIQGGAPEGGGDEPFDAELICPEDIEVDYQTGTKSIQVRSNVDFNVSVSQNSWLTVSQSGKDLRFTYQENSAQESRSVKVTLTSDEYNISESFNFIQGGAPQGGGDEPFDAELICPEDIEVDYQAGTKSIQVRSNVDFNVSVSQNSWLTVSKSGMDLRFTYQENSSTESRSANVTLTNSEYNISEQFLFIQGGAPQGGGSQGGGDNVVMWRDWAELPVCNEREGFDYVVHGGITVGGKSNQRNFTICFDREHKLATWVAYPLHKIHTTKATGRTDAWGYGPGVPTQYQPNLSSSYVGNYDRGHQIPSGDRTGSREMNEDTFYYTNMTPQASQFNRGGWATLENDVRSEICSDTLYVVTGALFLTSNDSSIAKQTTDKSGKTCPIPSHYYKVLLRTKNGNTGKAIKDITNASELKAIAILIKHKSTCNIQNSDYIPIKELERQSGYTFFPALNDAIEDEVKSQCNPSAWF